MVRRTATARPRMAEAGRHVTKTANGASGALIVGNNQQAADGRGRLLVRDCQHGHSRFQSTDPLSMLTLVRPPHSTHLTP